MNLSVLPFQLWAIYGETESQIISNKAKQGLKKALTLNKKRMSAFCYNLIVCIPHTAHTQKRPARCKALQGIN